MNSATLMFLSAPFAMCLILVGIHCYLGLHVLSRGVIFVDLSLAQVACLGTTLAMLGGIGHDTAEAYFISLAVTFVAASFFALARRYEKLFAQEALIGIVYAMASAAIVLVVDRLAHGAEHIKEILVGQILWVSWHEVFKTAAIYSAVGVVHYIFRKPLLAASRGEPNPKNFIWDFLFYALFGVVITSSARVAGVLLVFTYLIVPAIVASIFIKSVRGRLIFGWIFGTLLSLIGLGLSNQWDMPAGALIVVLFTIIPIVLLAIAPLVFRGSKTALRV